MQLHYSRLTFQRSIAPQINFKTPISRRFSSAMAQHGHSAACCSIPPIISKGYEAKGEYETLGGMKTCKYLLLLSICVQLFTKNQDVTGPTNASKGLLYIYDIFGYFPQSLQGADILSTSDKDHQYQVFMPDFFEGKPADISWYVLQAS